MATYDHFKFMVAAMLLTVMVWALPQGAWAADGEFDSPGQAISWYSKGPGCLHVKVLALEQSANRTLDYSTFYVKDSEATTTLLPLALTTVSDEAQLKSLSKHILEMALPDSANIIADEVLKLATT